MAEVINRNMLTGVISEATLGEDSLFDDITRASAVFSLGRNIGAMPKGKTAVPIPATLISAGFVDGDTGKKPVTDSSIAKPELVAGKIAAIVLIPDDVIEDADIDLWESWIKPAVPEAFGAVLDAAALFGAGKPSSWTGFQAGLVPQAVAKGNIVNLGSNSLFDAIMARNGMIHKVNEDGFRVTGFAGDSEIEALLRGAKDENGRPMYNDYLNPITNLPGSSIAGKQYYSVENGAWFDPVNYALLIGGDFSKLIYSIRKEIYYKISKEATVTMPDGSTVNCFQQNVTAFLMEMRVGAAVLNPVNRKNQDEATRFPFAVLTDTPALGSLTVRTAAGSVTAGDTVVTVTEPLADGLKRIYKSGASAESVTLDAVLTTGWNALPEDGLVSGQTDGNVITVADVGASDNKAKASGSAEIQAKA